MVKKINRQNMPVLPLRDVVVYPNMVVPLFVGRQKSIKSLEESMNENDKTILLVTQKSADIDDPVDSELYEVGCSATILQLLKLPDGTMKVLVEGVTRQKILNLSENSDVMYAECEDLNPSESSIGLQDEALSRALEDTFNNYVKLNKKIPPEVMSSIAGIEDLSKLSDSIAAHMTMRLEEKQKVLELSVTKERVEYLIKAMESELDVLHVEKKIRGRVKQQMEKSQREYYLNEQMKAIQKELGEIGDEPNDLDALQKKIETVGLSAEAKEKVMSEFNKFKMMSPMSAEATVVRNYIDTVIALPWKQKTVVNSDLSHASKILDDDHHGLEKVKERILEYLAVTKRVQKLKGPILCLVGPPGVGKTSLGMSIAKSTNRKFIKMSLGGVRDEAEIRGHRRTYIGSMPGKVIQNLSKVKQNNPLLLLDEIDKMAMDFRGDPSSALLEVLDPEQNFAFNDHYLEVDFDLSDVMFIATANSMDSIPLPLLDRMEIIRLPGYTEDEKVSIAKKYLLSKQFRQNGLKNKELSIATSAIKDIIRYYTREAGVRGLDRAISKICRKVVKNILISTKKQNQIKVTSNNLSDYLGVKPFNYGIINKKDMVGQVNGLAWTSVGGELLRIECALMSGKGKITQTGCLGEVMQESITAAITVVRSRAASLGIDNTFHENKDLHIHVPDGATPKDGPSAGITMALAVASSLSNIPVRSDVAMTGEITLRGEVQEIGGLKEKLLAALRGGIKEVIIPLDNAKDLVEIPDNVKKALKIHPVKFVDEVFAIALKNKPVKTKAGKKGSSVSSKKAKTSRKQLPH
ncbi:MAG: endopeptidase La [Gammaproteobacteria bacterium]|jgi:ATP-dependent Lon protease|nr:endopeptidase La [Gammaproteobacteria bacterium]MBT4655011.1 endopeptidase La [Gammaproteobacteria bacterium]MBT5116475.1 endopeptidase La [Gammaproteobacteria bacterium]MBT6331433.1 endopeptidase La [Gammaproteobacteria bacterium]MBT7323183.1 endopeptidase La [Gammaproteobacteria bacterium]